MKASLIQEVPLPPQLSQQQLLDLYNQLRCTTVAELRERAADSLIKGHLRLGLSIALSFARRAPNKRADLISEMQFALVKGVRKIQNGALDGHEGFPNITGYLIKTIRGHLLRFYHKDRLLSVNVKTYQKKNGNVKKVFFSDFAAEHGREEYTLLELSELVSKSVKTEQERKVIGGRLSGETDREIGESLHISYQRVQQIRHTVISRMKELMQ